MLNDTDAQNPGSERLTLPSDTAENLLRLILVVFFLIGMTGMARADQRGVFPSDMPASYRVECGDCHIVFAPDLLSADNWHSIMGKLGEHFGVDAQIEADKREEIENFLVRNAGRNLRSKKNGDPLRLTDTLWFHRRHGKVKVLFQNPRVHIKANCVACHLHADEGSYDEYTPLVRKFMQKNSGKADLVRSP